jgi:predicted SprT family Zn-dependent metalloprotease
MAKYCEWSQAWLRTVTRCGLTVHDIIEMADQKLQEMGLQPDFEDDEWWDIEINGRLTRSLGRCNYGVRKIELQERFIMEGDLGAIEMVILHEVCHASGNRNHGKDFYRALQEMGGVSSRKVEDDILMKYLLFKEQ